MPTSTEQQASRESAMQGTSIDVGSTAIERDKNIVRRAHTIEPALKGSVALEMAEQRLAAAGIFYRPETDEFVTVSD